MFKYLVKSAKKHTSHVKQRSLAMDHLTTWYIEANQPLPTDLLGIFDNYSTSPANSAGNSISFITFGIPQEDIPVLAKNIEEMLKQNNINQYAIRTEKYTSTDEYYDIESDDWHEEPVLETLHPENTAGATVTPACNFALLVTETHHYGYIEDESAGSKTTRKIVLLPDDDDIIADYEASLYEDQDYSYHVNVKRIGILDLPGEKLVCDDENSDSAIIVRQYPGQSLDELQGHAKKFNSGKPIIFTSGPVIIKNLQSRQNTTTGIESDPTIYIFQIEYQGIPDEPIICTADEIPALENEFIKNSDPEWKSIEEYHENIDSCANPKNVYHIWQIPIRQSILDELRGH